MIPGYDPLADAGDCTFDVDAARNAIDFFCHKDDGCIRHVKGEKAGQLVNLEPWQQAIIANLFGWKRPDGTRRYRECLIFVPRKNGKTTIAAGIVLYMLFCDNEPGAEVYSAAADRDQASLIYQQAKGMVLQDESLKRIGQIHETSKSIVYGTSFYRAISADANTKHGYNTHCILVDELHAQRDRELVDVLKSSTGARRQPLTVYITTSDYDREGSICNEIHEYACKVRDGIVSDASFLPAIYEATNHDDWTSPEVWAKANPNLGVSVSQDYLERECKRAQETPTYENTFKRLHLNIRTEQDQRFIQMASWDACGTTAVDPKDLYGESCYAGLDLSSTRDITAFCLYFPDHKAVLPWFWIPADNAAEREHRDRVPYTSWARTGHIETTPGNVVDYDYIRRRIGEIGEQYSIIDIASDPWNATQIQTQLQQDGFSVVAFRQGFASMSAPTKEFEKLVVSRQLRHGGHPVLRWMASNVTAEMDAAGNIKVSKARSSEKIDGIVAAIMAIGRSMVGDSTPKTSVYETRGFACV